jgi:4a-hydroxytetrahydrobiopterin dehydratase
MARPTKLGAEVETWLSGHRGWTREGEALVRTYDLGDFSKALAFVVRVGLLAEKHDHHPDIDVRYKTVRLLWSTHDAGGITQNDLTLAEASDKIAG